MELVELDQCAVAADVAVAAGAAGQRQLLGRWPWLAGELGGDVAARQPHHVGAVKQEGRRGGGGDHAGPRFVAHVLAAGEELVVEDDLVTKCEG